MKTLFAIAILLPILAFADDRDIQTTAFTRDFLRSSDAATAAAKIGAGGKTIQWSVTNFGARATGAGIAAANGDYWIQYTNDFGNGDAVHLTNSTGSSIDFSYVFGSGTGSTLTPAGGGGATYDNGFSTASWWQGTWESSDPSIDPPPTVILISNIVTYTKTVPTGEISNSFAIVQANGGNENGSPQDDSMIFDPRNWAAQAYGWGHFESTPFVCPDAAFTFSKYGDYLKFTPGEHTLRIAPFIKNLNVMAYGATLFYGNFCCMVTPCWSGNVTWRGGTLYATDTGEGFWRYFNLTNLLMEDVSCYIPDAPVTGLPSDASIIATNGNEWVYNRCFFDKQQPTPWIFTGKPGTTNFVVRFINCKFTEQFFANGNGGVFSLSRHCTLLFSNCQAFITGCTFAWGTNQYVDATKSYFIQIETNAFVHLGGNSYDNQATGGTVATNIFQGALGKPPIYLTHDQ